MSRISTLLFLIFFAGFIFAQTAAKTDQHSSSQNIVIKLDGSVQNNIPKESESSVQTNVQTTDNENVSFSTTADGIYITINKGTNKIKLFALTGQLLLNGDLSQGRFFIPTRKGIYFLRINNNSYKVICK